MSEPPQWFKDAMTPIIRAERIERARRQVLITHPDNFPLLHNAIAKREELADLFGAGIPVHGDFNVPRFATRWEPPRERFIDWDKSEEAWLKYFGMGTTIQTTEPVFYLIDLAAFMPTLRMPMAMPSLRPTVLHSLT